MTNIAKLSADSKEKSSEEENISDEIKIKLLKDNSLEILPPLESIWDDYYISVFV